MNLEEILRGAVEKGASDIFLVAGQPLSYKLNGLIEKQSDQPINPAMLEELVDAMYTFAKRDAVYREHGDDDFSISIPSVGRFRINIYKQRGSWSAVLRVVSFE